MTNRSNVAPSCLNLSAKATTDVKFDMSISQDSILLWPVVDMISRSNEHDRISYKPIYSPCTAACAFSLFLHPSIIRLGFKAAKCRAASKPSPVLAPMTITVFPGRSTLNVDTSGNGARCAFTYFEKLGNLPMVANKASRRFVPQGLLLGQFGHLRFFYKKVASRLLCTHVFLQTLSRSARCSNSRTRN